MSTWYGASLIFEATHELKSVPTTLWEERVVLVHADEEGQARTLAEQIGRSSEHEYLVNSPEPHTLRWRFRGTESVYERVESLEQLPARLENLELQVLQFREEVRAEFSATRQDLRAQMRAGMGEAEARLTERITDGDEETRRQLQDMRTELLARIDQGDAETRRYMRVLHEDVPARIARIGEGRRSHE